MQNAQQCGKNEKCNMSSNVAIVKIEENWKCAAMRPYWKKMRNAKYEPM